MTFNQFYRNTAIVEAVIHISLAILKIPTNIWAIYKFYKKKLNKIFFILVTSLCTCNLAMSIPAMLNGFAKYLDRHPLGIFGCSISMFGGCAITTITMMVQVLISYERGKVVTSVSFLTFHYRVYFMLVLSIIYATVFWIVYFAQFNGFTYLTVFVQPNSTKTLEVCCTSDMAYFGVAEVIFASVAFIIPTAFILYNYWFVTFFFLLLKNNSSPP